MGWLWFALAFLAVLGLVWFFLHRDAKKQAQRRGGTGTATPSVDLPRGVEKRLEDGKELPPGHQRRMEGEFKGKGKGRENAPGQLKKEE